MMIQGKSCTLTVAKDGYYYPLPYSEETVRQASKGYALPGVIGIRNREKLVETGKAITGCVVTRLEYNNILALFLLLFIPMISLIFLLIEFVKSSFIKMYL